jgi:phage-related protein
VPAEGRDGSFIASNACAFARFTRSDNFCAEQALVKVDRGVADLSGKSAPKGCEYIEDLRGRELDPRTFYFQEFSMKFFLTKKNTQVRNFCFNGSGNFHNSRTFPAQVHSDCRQPQNPLRRSGL